MLSALLVVLVPSWDVAERFEAELVVPNRLRSQLCPAAGPEAYEQDAEAGASSTLMATVSQKVRHTATKVSQ